MNYIFQILNSPLKTGTTTSYSSVSSAPGTEETLHKCLSNLMVSTLWSHCLAPPIRPLFHHLQTAQGHQWPSCCQIQWSISAYLCVCLSLLRTLLLESLYWLDFWNSLISVLFHQLLSLGLLSWFLLISLTFKHQGALELSPQTFSLAALTPR